MWVTRFQSIIKIIKPRDRVSENVSRWPKPYYDWTSRTIPLSCFLNIAFSCHLTTIIRCSHSATVIILPVCDPAKLPPGTLPAHHRLGVWRLRRRKVKPWWCKVQCPWWCTALDNTHNMCRGGVVIPRPVASGVNPSSWIHGVAVRKNKDILLFCPLI